MAAAHIEGHKPLPRSESLQKMLDLERQYKLARLQQSKTSPTPPDAPVMSFQTQIRPPVPLQTRRRNSRESLNQQHQQQQFQLPHSLDLIPPAVRRSGPASPLSITIPSPIDPNDKGQLSQRSQKATLHNMATDSDERTAGQDSQGETTPREKSVNFTTNGHIHEEDEGEESDQSSICQSPSWEGYGQKKKDKKKKEAELRKKEKERLDQEQRAAYKKKATNRLYKNPPPDSPDLNGLRDRPSSSASARLDSSHGPGSRSGRFSSSHQSRIQEVWGIGMGSGLGSVPITRPIYSRAPSAAGSTTDQDPPRSAVLTMPQIQQQNSSGNRGLPSATEETPSSSSNDQVSYPPTSSRSHVLRSALPTTHSRQNSASTITGLSSKPDDKNGQLHSTTNTSDQALGHLAEPVERGRQSAESGSSYVRKARAQSIERSIKGFMQEAALSDPNLLNGPNRTQFAYLGTAQQDPHPNGHRPSSSQSRITRPFGKSNGENGVNGNTAQSTSTITVVLERQEKPGQQAQQPQHPEKQHKQKQAPQQTQPQRQQQPRHQPEQPSPEKNESPEKEGDSNTDYLNFVSQPYSPPSLDLTTPASGGGNIFTSIKSRIGRRSSTSSGSTSNTNTGRSFKERAMGAMHLYNSNNATSAATSIPLSQPPSRMHSQNSSQTAASSIVSSTKNETSSSSTSHNLQIPHRDTRRLPKAARVLGEVNQETMSQGPPAHSRPSEGSSTSSYHDDSSVPPSPASTPDTSRPQSAKGLSDTIEEIQIGTPNMFLPSEEDLTKPQTQHVQVNETNSATSSNTTEETRPRRPSRRTENTRDTSVDRPRSKGRVLDDLERPTSRGRLLENVERPGSRGRVLEEVKAAQATGQKEQGVKEADEIIFDSATTSSPDLAEGLGILDEAWSQSTVTPDNDAQSFVTTLTNQKSGASLKSQFGNLKEAVMLAEAQNALGVHPALVNDQEAVAPPAYQNALQEVDETDFAEGNVATEKTQLGSNLRKKEKRSSQQAKHMSVLSEEPRLADRQVKRATSPAPAGSDPRKTSIDVSFLPPLRHEAFIPPKSKARNSAPPPPRNHDHEAQPTQNVDAPADQVMPSGRSSPSAMYLQEARRSAPLVSSPLSNVIRSAKANMSTPSLARPGLKTSASFSGAAGYLPLPPPQSSSASAQQPASAPTSPPFRIPAHEPEQLTKSVSKPLAKMLVECCHCKFFHDMPSRVYECMAQPDAVVTDRDLGVSGAITTMVKCPWCSHNMSTQCCAGYAAVVYLKERLH
ncbi:hypothetical protein SEUCBS139899_003644 [Sporothrix eucalyptigena]|uniref:Uncharacterized protein n=1 Tax=Sporothrix eucalyptigena TaxID=1812306 RepID=A0ABP0CS34_9PEZI